MALCGDLRPPSPISQEI